MKFFKRTDILIVLGILAVALTGYISYQKLAEDEGLQAQIFYENTLLMTVSLTQGQDYDFSVPGHEDVVFHVYPDGSIAFVESDCPDKVCIKTGKLRLSGQSAACLPNGLVLRVNKADGSSDDPDVVIR